MLDENGGIWIEGREVDSWKTEANVFIYPYWLFKNVEDYDTPWTQLQCVLRRLIVRSSNHLCISALMQHNCYVWTSPTSPHDPRASYRDGNLGAWSKHIHNL